MAIFSLGKVQKKANNFKTNDDNILKFWTHRDIYLSIKYAEFCILTTFFKKSYRGKCNFHYEHKQF